MTSARMNAVCVTLLVLVAGGAARIWHVPGDRNEIQTMIDYWEVVDGDTISVWGYGTPPFTYPENIDFRDKSLYIANACYMPNPPAPPNQDDVIIDGGRQGTTVCMVNICDAQPAVLQGVTVTGGLNDNDYGGGMDCRNSSVSVLDCHILLNDARSRGGGVYWKGTYPATATFARNLVEQNNAYEGNGGGLFIEDWCACDVWVDSNVVRANKAVQRGGGLYLWHLTFDPPPTLPVRVFDNVVEFNQLTGLEPQGGGIYTWDWPYPARRNVVTDNEHNGIYTTFLYIGSMNLGEVDDPGFNTLMRNGEHDLVTFAVWPDQSHAVGNYWGYLDTPTILDRISGSGGVQLSPVSASSKWFDVAREPESNCQTDVLVTGDLRVARSLTVGPGSKFEFYLDPDCSLEGGDPGLTDLLVEGGGTVLTSVGTAEEPILYTSRRNMEPWLPGDWYGIRVRPGAEALFDHSEVRAAYCGIDVEPDATAHATHSRFYGCLFAGVYGRDGVVRVEDECEVDHNEVYGVRCELAGASGASRVTNCQVHDNGFAGVSFKSAPTDDAPHRISSNQVVGGISGPFPAMYGLELRGTGINVSVEDNTVLGFHQSGIDLWRSSPALTHNDLQGNEVSGVACLEMSSPLVRWNTVSLSQSGVFCDALSCPDLGTEASQGNNSILFENVAWVHSQRPASAPPLDAEYNWWGTPEPNMFPWKFIGSVDYTPWLLQPPGGDGGQSSDRVQAHLTGLGQPVPMPVVSAVRIPYQVARAGAIDISVVDISGRVVRRLAQGGHAPGAYVATWDRTDNRGCRVPEGVYLLRFEASGSRDLRKLVVAR